MLENERDFDRLKKPDREKPLKDLFGQLSAEKLISDVTELAGEGADASDALPIIQTYSAQLDAAKKTIQERFVYYSRWRPSEQLRKCSFTRFATERRLLAVLCRCSESFWPVQRQELQAIYQCARDAIESLETTGRHFCAHWQAAFPQTPTAIRYSKKRIQACLALDKGEISRKNIHCEIPKGTYAGSR